MSIATTLARSDALKFTGAIVVALSLIFSGLGHNAHASDGSSNDPVVSATDDDTQTLDGGEPSRTSADGILATGTGTALVRNAEISSCGQGKAGVRARGMAQVLAAGLRLGCTGAGAAAVVAEDPASRVSLTKSRLSTNGEGAPLACAKGSCDLASVTGNARQGALFSISGQGSVLVVDSDLTSALACDRSGRASDHAIALEGCESERASLTCIRSRLKSAITEGSLLLARNASADIVLDSTESSFDSFECDLLRAQDGSDVSLAMSGSRLEGNACTDAGSHTRVQLTDDATWAGLTTGEGAADVCVDASSNWVMAESCTVRNLSVEPGGVVVDERGDAVSIMCAGELVVRGTSDETLVVEGAYHLGPLDADDMDKPREPLDRTAFDQAFNTNTSLAQSARTQPRAPMAASQLQTAQVTPGPLDPFIDWAKQTAGI